MQITQLNYLKLLHYHVLWLSFLAFLTSCTTSPAQSHIKTSMINGRDKTKDALYRVKVPTHWKEIALDSLVDLTDTTQPIAHYEIHENDRKIEIVVHNFPSNTQVPPQFQVERWQRQFDEGSLLYCSSTPQAFSGYVGLLFEGTGLIQTHPVKVMAWALNMGTSHYQTLSHTLSSLNQQKRADVTIKVSGPPEIMQKQKMAIVNFARSFELIEEIPTRS